MLATLKKNLRLRYVRWLFPTVVQPQDVITVLKTGQMVIDGLAIDDREAKALGEEAKFLRKSRLYSIMSRHVLAKAYQKIYTGSHTLDDLTWGKAILYDRSIEDEIISTVERSALRLKEKQ